MDIASIASFLLPTLLSLLSGEGESFHDSRFAKRIGNEEKFFPSSKKYSKIDLRSCAKHMTMYGYGYRYPRAPRITYYDDPEYRFKWARAAIGNRATAAKSPWLAYLREQGVFDDIGKLLREKAAEYRAIHGVKPSSKKGAKRRITKLQRAIAALEDQDLLKDVAAELGDEYKVDYVTSTINRLKDEINKLEALVNWQPVAQTTTQSSSQPSTIVKQTATAKKAKGYGLMSGLGYGYFY